MTSCLQMVIYDGLNLFQYSIGKNQVELLCRLYKLLCLSSDVCSVTGIVLKDTI